MNNHEIRQAVLKTLLQSNRTGRITLPDWNVALKVVSIVVLNEQLDKLEKNQEVSDDMFPFVTTKGDPENEPIILDAYGRANLPEDFQRFVSSINSSIFSNVCGTAASKTFRQIVFYPKSKFDFRISSALYKPTLKRPIMSYTNGKIITAPIGVNRLVYTYIRKPQTPFYDFVLSNGEPVYLEPGQIHDGTNPDAASGTPSRSVEIEWPETMHVEFIDQLVQYFSIPTETMLTLQTRYKQKSTND